MFNLFSLSKKNVVVSFEGDLIRVAHISYGLSGLKVDKSFALNNEQLDGYLEHEKTKEFVVVANFVDFYQESFCIPSSNKKFFKKIIEIEIRKRSNIQDFSYVYSLSDDKVIENKKVREVFSFAVRNAELEDIVYRFEKKGKSVKGIYPDIIVQAEMINPTGGATLCVSEVGLNKNLFLVNEGKVWFVRGLESDQSGLDNFDIQNINMTSDYIGQNFKVNTSQVILFGSICDNYKSDDLPSMPVSSMVPPESISRNSEDFLHLMTAISGLYAKKEHSILPEKFKKLYLIKEVLKLSTALMFFLSLTGLGAIISQLTDIQESINRYDVAKRTLPDLAGILSDYSEKEAEKSQYNNLISYINKLSLESSDFQQLLYSLSNVNTKGVVIDSVDLNANKRLFSGILAGSAKPSSFEMMEINYSTFVDSLNDLDGVTVTNHRIGLEKKAFQVEIEYRWN